MMSVLMRSRIAVLAVALLGAGLAPLAAQAQIATVNPPLPDKGIPDRALSAGWPQLAGDVPVDPDVTMGTLPNGMRYLIERKSIPAGKAAMRLLITAGSAHEAHDQEGLAHFLEHMAFRGSTHIPGGEMTRTLERLGLRTGADTNAATGPDRTIYKFNLARGDAESITAGLKLMREIGSELTLDASVMDKERGVVLAELRMRDDPVMDMQAKTAKRQLGDHAFARPPGGRRDVIEKAPVARLRAFYDAYYRPERAVVVVVGDVDTARLVAEIEATFGDWKGRGAPGGDPKPVMTQPAGDAVSVDVFDGLPSSALALQWFQPYREVEMTRADLRRRLIEQLGASAINDRLAGMLEEAGRPSAALQGPQRGRIPGVWNAWTITAISVTDIDKTLGLMVTAWRQAAEYGITDAELKHAIDVGTGARMRGEGGGHAGSPDLIADLDVSQIMGGQPFISSPQNSALYAQQVRSITLEEVNQALKANLSGEPRLSLRAPAADKGEAEKLRVAFAKARALPVAPYTPPAAKPWPYTDFGPPGAVAERTEVADLGVTFVRFANNVRLTIKATKFRRDDVVVRVQFGHGRMDMPRDRIDASDLGGVIWDSGGLGKLTPTEQDRTLEQDRIVATFRELDDIYAVETCAGGCLSNDKIALQFQVVTAMFADPAWRLDLWNTLMHGSDDSEKAVPYSAQGVMRWNLRALLHDNDLRWVFNTAEMRKTWKPETALAYFKPIVAKAPLEVVVVGDVNIEQVIALAARTFGTLPARDETPLPASVTAVKFPKPTPKPVVLTHKGAADSALAYVAWPTTDTLSDPRGFRVRQVLEGLLQIRLTDALRVKQGKSYSPGVTSTDERALQGYGYIGVSLDGAPSALPGILATVDEIAADLGARPAGADEFLRALQPVVGEARTLQSNNAFWVDGLGGAQNDKRKLDMLRTSDADYSGITPADVQAEAKKWLRKDKAWRLTIVPEGKPAAKAPN